MVADDRVDDGEPEARSALPKCLEGLEDFLNLLGLHPDPLVPPPDTVVAALGTCIDAHRTTRRHGLNGVASEVVEGLSQLLGVRDHGFRVGFDVGGDPVSVGDLRGVGEQRERLVEGLGDVARTAQGIGRSREPEERFDDSGEAPRLLDDDSGELVLVGTEPRDLAQHLGRARDRGERVADFVGDSCRHLPHRLHPFAEALAFGRLAHLREITEVNDEADQSRCRIGERRDGAPDHDAAPDHRPLQPHRRAQAEPLENLGPLHARKRKERRILKN